MAPAQPGAACHPRSRSHRRGPPLQQRHALSSGACIPFPTTAATTAPSLALQQCRGQQAPLRCRASPRSRSPSRHLRAAANGAEDTHASRCRLQALGVQQQGQARQGPGRRIYASPRRPPSCHMHRGIAASIHLCDLGTHRTIGGARPFCCTRAGQHGWLVAYTFPAIRTAGLHQLG